MASELSKFIENELRNKGYAYDDDDAEANDNPHTSLIGALRVEARVKEQETQKKLFNIKRVVCIGGGVALVLIAWALLIASSRNKADSGYDDALRTFEGYGIEVDGDDEYTEAAAAAAKQAPQPPDNSKGRSSSSSKDDGGGSQSSKNTSTAAIADSEESPATNGKESDTLNLSAAQQQQPTTDKQSDQHQQPTAAFKEGKSSNRSSNSSSSNSSSPAVSPSSAAVPFANLSAEEANRTRPTDAPAPVQGSNSSAADTKTASSNSSDKAAASDSKAAIGVKPSGSSSSSDGADVPSGEMPVMNSPTDDKEIWEEQESEYADDLGDRRKRHRKLGHDEQQWPKAMKRQRQQQEQQRYWLQILQRQGGQR